MNTMRDGRAWTMIPPTKEQRPQMPTQPPQKRRYDQITGSYYPHPKLRALSQAEMSWRNNHPWLKQGAGQGNRPLLIPIQSFGSLTDPRLGTGSTPTLATAHSMRNPALAVAPSLTSFLNPNPTYSPKTLLPPPATLFCPPSSSVISSTPSFFPSTIARFPNPMKTQTRYPPIPVNHLSMYPTQYTNNQYTIPFVNPRNTMRGWFMGTPRPTSRVKLSKLQFDKKISEAKTLSEARRRFQEIDKYYGADSFSFSRVMKRCVMARRCELAHEYFKEMKNRNVQPNIVIYNIMIDACKETGNFAQAYAYYEEMENSGLSANDRTFNSMMNVCVKNGLLKEGMEVLENMQQKHIRPNHRTFTSLINVCVKDGLLEEALRLKDEMNKRKVRPDNRTYTSLINVCVKGGLLKEALKIQRAMETHSNEKPDDRTYNSLINVCVKNGHVDHAVQFKKDMFERGLPWDELTYTSLISTCIKDGRIQDALNFKVEMMNCNIRPNARTFTAMINVCVKGGLLTQAISLRDEMIKRCIWPNERTYNALINVCVKDGLLTEAKKLAAEMASKGMSFNSCVQNSLINVCVKNGNLAEALRIKTEMVEHGLSPDKQTHEYYLSVMVAAAKFDECKKYMSEHSDVFIIKEDPKQVFDVSNNEAGFAFMMMHLNKDKGSSMKVILGDESREKRGLSLKPVIKGFISTYLQDCRVQWHTKENSAEVVIFKSATPWHEVEK